MTPGSTMRSYQNDCTLQCRRLVQERVKFIHSQVFGALGPPWLSGCGDFQRQVVRCYANKESKPGVLSPRPATPQLGNIPPPLMVHCFHLSEVAGRGGVEGGEGTAQSRRR